MPSVTLLQGHILDKLEEIEKESIQVVVTSSPYWGGLRDYGVEPVVWAAEGRELCSDGKHDWLETHRRKMSGGPSAKQDSNKGSRQEGKMLSAICEKCGAWLGQLGFEPTPDLFVWHIVQIFRGVRRVLRPDGLVFFNIGDCYAGSGGAGGWSKNRDGSVDNPTRQVPNLKAKNLVGIPWRVALALQADGWYLRNEIIWHKPNPMPSSVTDRFTSAHEQIFMFSKLKDYFFDQEAIREPLSDSTVKEMKQGYRGRAIKDYAGTGAQDPSAVKARIIANLNRKQDNAGNQTYVGFNDRWSDSPTVTRNRRDVWVVQEQTPFEQFRDWMMSYLSLEESEMLQLLYQRFLYESSIKGDVWKVTPSQYREAHFATYPPELIEPCIKAGTSRVGCCPKCRAPWHRLTEKERLLRSELAPDDPLYRPAEYDGAYKEISGRGSGGYVRLQTLGWEAGCDCNAGDPIPCRVLDMFNGSGTAGTVSLGLGCDYYGVELKESYIDLTERRLEYVPVQLPGME